MYVDFGQIFSPVYSHANIYLKLIEAYNLLQFEVPFLYKDGLSYFSHVQLFATPWTVVHHLNRNGIQTSYIIHDEFLGSCFCHLFKAFLKSSLESAIS